MEKPISWPVQNMGHFSQGLSLAFPSHVLKYGLRTINGSTGGVKREDSTNEGTAAARTANAETSRMMGNLNCRTIEHNGNGCRTGSTLSLRIQSWHKEWKSCPSKRMEADGGSEEDADGSADHTFCNISDGLGSRGLASPITQ